MAEMIDIEQVRELLKSRDTLVDLETLFDTERETSASQDIEDYFEWVDRLINKATEV